MFINMLILSTKQDKTALYNNQLQPEMNLTLFNIRDRIKKKINILLIKKELT